ncbi:hypothetical protein ACIGDI_41500 [Streptomyces sp. NPDC085900]|uniref:hypothetical protein n=1 Tax=Streptomyces sp. NPDC085900 TaxID=3365737 RepID=UPI0037D8FDFD
MRPMYVPVRLAATVLAVATAAGCMSVGEDAGGDGARPSHSAGRHGGEAPDGGTAISGGGWLGAAADGKHPGKKGKGKDGGKSASPSASPSAGATASAPARGGAGRTDQPGAPTPTRATPTATHTDPQPPTPTEQPTSSAPEPPPSAEPSSSAHPDAGPQLAQREPAPTAGSPV